MNDTKSQYEALELYPIFTPTAVTIVHYRRRTTDLEGGRRAWLARVNDTCLLPQLAPKLEHQPQPQAFDTPGFIVANPDSSQWA